MNLEIYDEWGGKVFSTKSSKPVSYDEGTYSFTWNGFPSGGGLQCDSGNYTLKYWVSGGNPKQSTVWMDIY
jgi:flagellar hook assembly protein FlgD